jgi:hypothetical protein
LAEAARRNWAEVEWWATGDFRKLGVVIFDSIDEDWNVVVLKSKSGQYQTCDVEASLKTQQVASLALQGLLKGERKSNYHEVQQILSTKLNGGKPLESDQAARQIIFDRLNEPYSGNDPYP